MFVVVVDTLLRMLNTLETGLYEYPTGSRKTLKNHSLGIFLIYWPLHACQESYALHFSVREAVSC